MESTCDLSDRSYYNVGQRDQRRQARQYAISGDKQGHEMFELGGQKVCNAAMCALVGFSSGYWKAQKDYRNQRIVLEEEHGNKVRIHCTLKIQFLSRPM